MTEAERKLLVWCAIMLLRDTPLTKDEVDDIDQLIWLVKRESEPGVMPKDWHAGRDGRDPRGKK